MHAPSEVKAKWKECTLDEMKVYLIRALCPGWVRYRGQFIEKLGFDPYPGTVNLRLTTEYPAKLYRTKL